MSPAPIEDAKRFLRCVAKRVTAADPFAADQVRDSLAQAKTAAVARGDEAQAKEIWCLEEVLRLQALYLTAFEQLRRSEFYEAWCSLARAEVTAAHVLPHLDDPADQFQACFLGNATIALQKLFPYGSFFSCEWLEGDRRCSICDKPVLPRQPCGHRVGEIYGGEMACIIVHPKALLGVSIVDRPRLKETVVFLSSPEGQRDHYDYSFLTSVVRRIPTPLTPWRIRWEPSRLVARLAGSPGRNSKCPCRSGLKFKHCCLRKGGVLISRAFLELEYGTATARVLDAGGIFGEVPEKASEIAC